MVQTVCTVCSCHFALLGGSSSLRQMTMPEGWLIDFKGLSSSLSTAYQVVFLFIHPQKKALKDVYI